MGNFALQALMREAAVTLDRSRCVRHRCTANACTRCIDVCPTDSFTWTKGGLQINPDTCTQCLSCLSVCPTAALASPGLSLPQVLADLAQHRLPVLGCKGQPGSDAHVRISCLGYLAHPELMTILALVFPEGLQLNLTACDECPNGHILDGIVTAHGRLHGSVSNHAVKLIRDKKDLEYAAATLSRRQFFLLFQERTNRAAVTMVKRLQDNIEQKTYGKKQIPEIRALLLKAMSASTAARKESIKEQQFGKITFTSDCCHSERCVGVCPTGAIRSSRMSNSPPVFDQTLCTSCFSCQAFCRNRGVVLSDNSQIPLVTKREQGL
ncbi:MAG: 4Fe-4S binding protein [Gammaproteobacteria bacterium]|nr:4Fe-4S binding protein [Gammaproteobacteria bacterium]